MGKSITIWLTLSLAFVVLLLGTLYGPLNITRTPLYSFETHFDSWVPFVPIFSLPYLSYYLYLLVTVALLVLTHQQTRLQQVLLATVIILVAAYFIYGNFQSHVTRPTVVGSGVGPQLVLYIYNKDNPFNAFPSLHTALSALCMLALYRHTRRYWAFLIWGLVIIASTVLIKQHYILDIFGGIALAVVSFWLSCRALPELNTTIDNS